MSASENQCERMQDLLSEFVDGQLNASDTARVTAHVAICPDCASYLGFLKATSFVVANRLPDVRPPADLFAHIAAMTYARPTWQQRLSRFLAPAPTRLALGTAFAVGILAAVVLPQAMNRETAQMPAGTLPIARSSDGTTANPSDPAPAIANVMPNVGTSAVKSPLLTPVNRISAPAHPAAQVAERAISPTVVKPSRKLVAMAGIRGITPHLSERPSSHPAQVAIATPLVTKEPSPAHSIAPPAALPTPHLTMVAHRDTMHLSASTIESLRSEHAEREIAFLPNRTLRPDERKNLLSANSSSVPVIVHDTSAAVNNVSAPEIHVPLAAIAAPAPNAADSLTARHTLDATTGRDSAAAFQLSIVGRSTHGSTLLPRNNTVSVVSAQTGNGN